MAKAIKKIIKKQKKTEYTERRIKSKRFWSQETKMRI